MKFKIRTGACVFVCVRVCVRACVRVCADVGVDVVISTVLLVLNLSVSQVYVRCYSAMFVWLVKFPISLI